MKKTAKIRFLPSCHYLATSGILLMAFASALNAQTPATSANPFLGSWKLNLERSKFPTPRPRDFTWVRVYEDHGGGLMLHTIISGQFKGGFLFAAVKYDGNEYPVYVSETLGTLLSTGTKSSWMLTYTRVDTSTLQSTDKLDGKLLDRGTCTVSRDGKIMTETVKTFDDQGKETSLVEIYDKQ